MKYVWIVMLIILYVIWIIATIKDVYEQINGIWKFPYCLKFLEWYSYAFVIAHLFTLFIYSLYVWRGTL